GEIVRVVEVVVENHAVAGHAAQSGEIAAEGDAAGAGDGLAAGDAEQLVAVSAEHAGGIGGARRDSDARISDAKLVDGGGREGVGPVDDAAGGGGVVQGADLRGQDGLGGAVLRIPVDGEASEQTVPVGDAVIDLGVGLVVLGN